MCDAGKTWGGLDKGWNDPCRDWSYNHMAVEGREEPGSVGETILDLERLVSEAQSGSVTRQSGAIPPSGSRCSLSKERDGTCVQILPPVFPPESLTRADM